jgi:hypothetical protein
MNANIPAPKIRTLHVGPRYVIREFLENGSKYERRTNKFLAL